MENTTATYINSSDSSMSRTWDEVEEWMNQKEVKIPYSIFLCIILIVGVLGNGFALYLSHVIYRETRFTHQSQSAIIIFLSFNDLFISGMMVPIELVVFLWSGPRSSSMLYNFSLLLTSLSIAGLVLGRFLDVSQYTTRAWIIAIASVILITICSFSPLIVGVIHDMARPMSNATTSEFAHEESGAEPKNLTLFGIGLFTSTFITVCIFSCVIVIMLFRQSREAGRLDDIEGIDDPRARGVLLEIMDRTRESQTLDREAKRETKRAIIVAIVFICTLAPALVLAILQTFWNDISPEEMITLLLIQSIFRLNYVIKPVIFYKLYPLFKKESRRILQEKWNYCRRKLVSYGCMKYRPPPALRTPRRIQTRV